MKKTVLFILMVLMAGNMKCLSQTYRRISAEEFKSKVEGYWYGQLVGNYLGFPFELLYNDEPIPIPIDRYYNVGDLDSIDLQMHVNDRRGYTHIMADALGGAWSDDDTDIEFVTLHAVEKYGLDITYGEISKVWKASINRFIWAANKRSRELMDEGMIPPATGNKENTKFWNGMSPQLVNEIWSVFYPGMVSEALNRAEWGARISCDDWGTHPTMAYSVMFSAAFFESNTERLVQMAMESLPQNSPYREGMQDVIDWYHLNEDWRVCRDLIHEKYYHFRNHGNWEPTCGLINGLSGIMAILYGKGDFMQTSSIAVSAGYDCDNQAATCAGLLGIMNGAGAIPESLLLDLPSRNKWSVPFNDTYINYSRDKLPNCTAISEIIDRIIAVSEEAIVGNGGEILNSGPSKVYRICTSQ